MLKHISLFAVLVFSSEAVFANCYHSDNPAKCFQQENSKKYERHGGNSRDGSRESESRHSGKHPLWNQTGTSSSAVKDNRCSGSGGCAIQN